MSEITVRRWVSEDLAPIADHYGSVGETPWDPFCSEDRLRQIPLDGLVVGEMDGQYAGFLYWFLGNAPWFDPDVGAYAHVLEVQVLPPFRRQGVGTALLEHALQRLAEEPIEAVYIDTTEDNEAAQSLYQGKGFRRLSTTIHYKRSPRGP